MRKRSKTRTEPSARQLRVGEEVRHALARIFERHEMRDPALLDVTRPGGTEHRRVHQTFTVAGGLVVDIRPGG